MGRRLAWLQVCRIATLLLLLAPFAAAPVRADNDKPSPAPRTVVTIGGVSVVLVVANDRVHVFLDRLADNSPVVEAGLSIKLADNSPWH